MKIKRSLVVAGAVATIGLASLAGVASAETNTNSLVDKIAQKFNVDKNEVQKVFDEERTSRQAEHQSRYEEKLNQAVKDGKITEEQKSKIVAKHKELMAEKEKHHESREQKRAEFENKSEAEREASMKERRTEMEQKRAEIEQWEKDNGIPSGYLMMMGGHGRGHGGPGGPF